MNFTQKWKKTRKIMKKKPEKQCSRVETNLSKKRKEIPLIINEAQFDFLNKETLFNKNSFVLIFVILDGCEQLLS